MDTTQAPHEEFDVTVTVAGSPQQVFPLLCPVREYDWIPGWACELVHSRSGVAELGCVFRTRHPLGEETWTVSRYEPPLAVGFVRVVAGVWSVLMDLELAPAGGTTSLRVRHAFTALGPAGTTALEDLDRRAHEAQWRHLGELAGHYLRTGTMLLPTTQVPTTQVPTTQPTRS